MKSPDEKIGLFGGTFNPVHFGHINLAIELKERGELDQVWVIPAYASPLRANEELAAPAHRFKMAELAFGEIPGFSLLDLELRRAGSSFTIDTVTEILKKFSNKSFYLLLGEDSLTYLHQWKEINRLIEKIPLLIGRRAHSTLSLIHLPLPVQEAVLKGLIETPRIEISATGIRQRIKKRLYCDHLAPKKVLDYIDENQLYF